MDSLGQGSCVCVCVHLQGLASPLRIAGIAHSCECTCPQDVMCTPLEGTTDCDVREEVCVC